MAKITDLDKPSEKKKKSSSSKKKSLKEHIEDEDEENKIDTTHLYADNLNGDVYTETNANPKAKVHSTEWMKILHGDPVEINPSLGQGMKIMTVAEWTSRWKQTTGFRIASLAEAQTRKNTTSRKRGAEVKKSLNRKRFVWIVTCGVGDLTWIQIS